jgi:intracellular sulfur oxidation DsrE/DsrF family protein
MAFWQGILQRRSFVMRFTAASLLSAPVAAAKDRSAKRWEAQREAKDDWLDRIPGKHRMIFDSTQPEGFASALMYANNFFIGNKDGYSLGDRDIAVVIVARHFSTPFAFNDAIWKRYGDTISRLSKFTDPKTNQAPVNNVHMMALEALLKRGVHFAVCEMATRQLAGSMASDSSGNEEAVFKEITANLVPNSHLVPAGIVAVNRAQERGYACVGT